MEIKTYILGPIQTNTYMLTIGDEAILIDPASKPEKCIELLKDKKLVAILLTHGHFDHIKAVDGLYQKYNCPVYLHEDDEYLARDKYSGKDFGLVSYISVETIPLKEGVMEIGEFKFEVVFTPGHTSGSVVYVFEDAIFTGDTLFKGSVGRTDLEGGSSRELNQSLNYFRYLKKDYLIYPGHDTPTTLSEELRYNPFL